MGVWGAIVGSGSTGPTKTAPARVPRTPCHNGLIVGSLFGFLNVFERAAMLIGRKNQRGCGFIRKRALANEIEREIGRGGKKEEEERGVN